jgi:hypothetical protein
MSLRVLGIDARVPTNIGLSLDEPFPLASARA